jgi:TP901 family phage tail tape measure protein
MSGRFTVETVFKGTDQTSGVLGALSAKTKAFQKGLAGPSAFADKGWAGIKQVGIAAAAAGAGAVGLGLAFKEALTPGADFDQAMSAVGAVSLKSRKEVADLEAEARRLGKTTKFSATEVAGGMELMGKAGFENSDIISGIAPLLNAAAAEGAGFEETASVISNTIKGMGMNLDQTSRVADVLTLASARTNSSISSLGESMAIVAPTARQLNVPFEDAAAAVAMLQDKGLDASVAGSAVATMLTNLSKPPKEVAAKMKAMGVSFQDAHGDMLPFRDVIGQLAKAGTKAGGNMAQVAFFADLVGMRGQKAALNLKDIGPALAKLTDDLHGATGSAEKMAALKMDNFLGDVTLLGNAVKDLGIDVFDVVKGPLRDAAQGARSWLNANQDLIKSDVKGWVVGITENIGPMRENIEKGVAALGWFKDGLAKAFEHSASVAVFGTMLDKTFGGKDGEGFGKKAYDLGHGIGYAVDKFVLFTGIVKGAELAIWTFGNAVKIVKGITIAYEAALALGGWATTGLGWAINTTTGSTVAFGGAMTTASLAAGEAALAEQGLTFATVELEAAAAPAAAGIAGIGAAAAAIVAPLAAAAAAAGAAYLAYDQFKAFEKENGGWEGVKGFFGVGTQDWGYEGISEVMDRQARAERADQDAMEMTRRKTPTGRDWATEYGFGAGPTPMRPPGPYADGYQAAPALPPAPPPMLVSARDQGSAETAKSNSELKAAINQLTSKLNANGGTVKLFLPKGVTAETSGAPGVEVMQSGGF